MRLSKAWLIAIRDFKIFGRQKNLWYGLVIFPVIIALLPPTIIQFAANREQGLPAAAIPSMLDSFSVFLIIGAAFVPVGIASYSIVGEKIEKSLEPLLATPITDGEILLGKTISAFLPTLGSMYTGAVLYMISTNAVTYPILEYYYFPNEMIGIVLLLLMPAAIVMSVEFGVIISSRVNDVRSSNSLGILMFFPFLAIYLANQMRIITLDIQTLLLITGIIFVIDVILFFVSTALFSREEILTKWK